MIIVENHTHIGIDMPYLHILTGEGRVLTCSTYTF